MANNIYGYDSPNPYSEELAYDLRITYQRIVSLHLLEVYESRRKKSYPDWLRNLKSLYTVIAHKLNTKTRKEYIEKYQEILKEVIKIINDNQPVYFGKSSNPKGVGILEDSLMKLERFLYYCIDETNMFGSKRQTVGL